MNRAKQEQAMRRFQLAFFLVLATMLFGGQALAQPTEAATVADTGMVASVHQLASEAALEVLQQGGNAVDAAAVAQFVLNVVEPAGSGIGGGNFIMIYLAEENQVIAIDAREEAPERYHEEIFLDEEGEVIPFGERSTGGNPVGVPGTLAGIAKALEMYGTITLADALQPAIAIAEEGFALSEFEAAFFNEAAPRLELFPSSAATYLKEDGSPWMAGDTFANPDLAGTFRLIAEEGIEVFYQGELADEIVAAVQNDEVNPGVMERADLEAYLPVLREPVQGTYRGHEIFSMAPPTSGGPALVQMLNILEDYDLAQLGWDSPERIHLFNEAQKVAFADRNRYLADADWVDVPVAGLTSKEFAAERRELIDPEQALPAPVDYGDPWAYETGSAPSTTPLAGGAHGDEGYHTTHFSVIDADRNMVSVTSTIERFWGSALTVPGRGFLLNNQLTDFEAVPVHDDGTPVANRPEGGKQPRRTSLDAPDTLGGKRPRSSMTPTLVLRDGEPFMAVGSPGGSRIIGIVLNVVSNVIDHGMDPQEAITAARIVNRGGAMEVEAELYDANPDLVAALEALGHEVAQQEPFGGAHAVMVDPETGRLLGGADPRREGYVAGY